MRVIEDIAWKIRELLKDRKILEVACGNADFSMEAVKYARLVLATDTSLDSYRYCNRCYLPVNLALKVVESPCTGLEDAAFDVSVCYNKLSTISADKETVIKEMARVTKTDGYLVFAATLKAEKIAVNELVSSAVFNETLKVYKEIFNSRFSMLIMQKK